MLEAFFIEEQRQDDVLNQRISWQTAHLMNASGNLKRRISPTDLYKPMAEQEEHKQNTVKRFNSKEEKEQYLKDLMKKFES